MILKEKTFKIIGQVMEAPIDEINEDSSPDNLEKWDSFHHMSLVLALEDEFNIKFTDVEIMSLENAGIILEALKNKGIKA